MLIDKNTKQEDRDSNKRVEKPCNENTSVNHAPQLYLSSYQCDFCNMFLALQDWRFRCVECSKPDEDCNFDICMECFVQGKETDSYGIGSKGKKKNDQRHFSWHKYMVISPNNKVLFHRGWSGDEELFLLEGLSKFGFGNWVEISDLVNQIAMYPKTPAQCESHYQEIYLNSPCSPLPKIDNLLNLDKFPIKLDENSLSNAVNNQRDNTVNSNQLRKTNYNQRSANSKIVGYWPMRRDFDVEHNNEAELLISDLEFTDNDLATEKLLKFQVLEIYNSKLDERIYRKNVILKRGLFDLRSMHYRDKRLSKEERELHSILRPLSRYQSPEEHERLIHLFVEEKNLRNRLNQLQQWKSLGFKTLSEIKQYEYDKLQRFQQNDSTENDIQDTRNSKRLRQMNKSGNEYQDNCGIDLPVNSSTIEHLPGSEILNETEKALCISLKLHPSYYIFVKRVLLVESLMRHNTCDSLKAIEIAGNKSGPIVDFFMSLDCPCLAKSPFTKDASDKKNSRKSQSL